jgi:hypothetical protein
MEDYPREAYALLTVVAVEEAHVVVADADGVRHRARCIPSDAGLQAEPLRPGDVFIVNQVNPGERLTMVERVNTLGRRDGSRYTLLDHQLASKAEPA